MPHPLDCQWEEAMPYQSKPEQGIIFGSIHRTAYALAYAVTVMHKALLFARKQRYTCLYLRGPCAPHGSMLNIITLTTRKACSQHALHERLCKQLSQRALTQKMHIHRVLETAQ